MVRISQIKLPINYNDQDIVKVISKKLGLSQEDILSFTLRKRSLDARKKPDIFFNCTIDVQLKNESKHIKRKKLQKVNDKHYVYPKATHTERPIIVGFGPAGLFAAYLLAEVGLKPIVFERGEDVDNRTKSVEAFWQSGILNEASNVQYGEGGAGTFSDGKLTTRSKDPRANKVMEILVEHGAPEEILYSNKPHVGTDLLKHVVKSMREKIITLGGEIHFSTKVESFIIDGSIKGIVTEEGKTYNSNHVIVAVGHSARDTYQVLYDAGLSIEQKPFAMGVRVEHHQKTIDINQYGSLNHREHLGASDYKLTYQASNGRSVYSFCVCPGGMVVASASEEGGLVVNGMSEHARDQENINGALLVQIKTEDFGSEHPLAGVEFQRKYEKLAYELGGCNYHAPAQTIGSFLDDLANGEGDIKPSYNPKVKYVDIEACLPSFVVEALREGIRDFGNKIKGFDDPQSVLTAIESRSSAPIRMYRDFKTMESNIKGLYPVGEGAGYAGGIVSSAIDGLKIAEIVATI